MTASDVLVHLRLPFSWVLGPVFFFAATQGPGGFGAGFWIAAVCQFFLLYPASHAYNSFYDRDEGPIGGVARPPRVGPELRNVAWGLFLAAVALASVRGSAYAVSVGLYALASMAYSHPRTRWKARPVWGWIVVSVMQGGFTYVMTLLALGSLSATSPPRLWGGAAIATLWIAAGYPLTQVYQHAEDARRGDRTLSRLLGVRGTLVFCAVGFGIAQALLAMWSVATEQPALFWVVQAGYFPSIVYLAVWLGRRPGEAGFGRVMSVSYLSSTGVNGALLAYLFLTLRASP